MSTTETRSAKIWSKTDFIITKKDATLFEGRFPKEMFSFMLVGDLICSKAKISTIDCEKARLGYDGFNPASGTFLILSSGSRSISTNNLRGEIDQVDIDFFDVIHVESMKLLRINYHDVLDALARDARRGWVRLRNQIVEQK